MYTYVGNSPLCWADPLGLQTEVGPRLTDHGIVTADYYEGATLDIAIEWWFGDLPGESSDEGGVRGDVEVTLPTKEGGTPVARIRVSLNQDPCDVVATFWHEIWHAMWGPAMMSAMAKGISSAEAEEQCKDYLYTGPDEEHRRKVEEMADWFGEFMAYFVFGMRSSGPVEADEPEPRLQDQDEPPGRGR